MSTAPDARPERSAGRGGDPPPGGRRDRTIRFLETLGRGGFGAVYLAEVETSEGLVQRLAVKVLSAEMSGHHDIAGRQRDEARLLSRLNHDNIVKVFDLSTVHGRPAVLMEFVDGADAAELVKRGPFSPRAALQVIAATASALHFAWSAPAGRGGAPLRVIHRDIKPANLLVSRHGGVKVLDFGIARGDFDREGKTESVQFGTARYMAPEQWLYGQVSHAVDVYALGVTLAELMAGSNLSRAPLSPEKFDAHVAIIVDELVTGKFPPMVGAELASLFYGMLAFDPEQRLSAEAVYEKAISLIDELPGEGLNRLAARLVGTCVDQRRDKYRNDPVLDAISVSHETVSPTGSAAQLPPGAPPTPAGHPVAPSRPIPDPGRPITAEVPIAEPTPSAFQLPRSPTGEHTRAVLAAETVRAPRPREATVPPPPPGLSTVTPQAPRPNSTTPPGPGFTPRPSNPRAAPRAPAEAPRKVVEEAAPARSIALPLAIGAAFLLTLVVGGLGALLWFGRGETAPAPAPVAEALAPTPASPAEPPPAPAPTETVAAADVAVTTPAKGTDSAKATSGGGRKSLTSTEEPDNTRIVPNQHPEEPVSSPSPAPVEAAPPPAPAPPPPVSPSAPPAAEQAAAKVSVKFTSAPLGATVYVDGSKIGNAPITVNLTVGDHTVRMEADGQSASKPIHVSSSFSTKFHWKVGPNAIENKQ